MDISTNFDWVLTNPSETKSLFVKSILEQGLLMSQMIFKDQFRLLQAKVLGTLLKDFSTHTLGQ
ncbi:MAG: hypothetical protein B7Y25_06145 [Alphaproteobacteria bacterium 16-39-46]|nr:MAG: hypothetical protein B7Y25_06145 [Alphaproteobacteria bacterium 16-39-46]OZA42394.1 MAG: hypothetical protein B7X84_06150 [Alphaproteobacteria bacterium 17-39-52]